MSSRDYFQGKRVAVIGLGQNGEMVTDVKFMIKAGAIVSIYDLKSEARLKSHLVFLRSVGLANYVCGSIPADDLLDMDLIVLSHEYPRDSTFLKPLREKKIPVEYPETLFFKLSPPVTLIGVIGNCGKSSVISMLSPILEKVCDSIEGQGFFLMDPDSSGGVLANVFKVKNGDIVLARITDLLSEELQKMRISPHVAVFTQLSPSSPSLFSILAHQTYNNYIVASDEVVDLSHQMKAQLRAKMLRTKPSLLPADWEFKGKASFDRENAALAIQAARLFKASDELCQHILENWKPLKGRLEAVKKVKGVEFFNDTASTVSWSTERALLSLAENKNAVLVMGGARSAGDYKSLYSLLPQCVHTVVLLPGSGTLAERKNLSQVKDVNIISAPSIEEAARLALENARKGDKVIFSPGFEAGGADGSKKERGEKFVKAVKSL